MFSKLAVVKFVATGLVGLGTGKIIGSIIKNNVTPANIIEKVSVVAATAALSGLVTSGAKKYTDDIIDSIVAEVQPIVDSVKLRAKLGRIDRNESTFEKEGLDATKYHKDEKSGLWVPNDDQDAVNALKKSVMDMAPKPK